MCPSIVRDQRQLYISSRQTTSIVITQNLCICFQLVNTIQQIRLFNHLELRSAVHKHAQHIKIIIRPFRTIYDRTPFHGNTSPVSLHLVIRLHRTRLHIEMNGYFISFFPTAVYAEITVLQFTLYRFSIYFHCIAQTLSIQISVQVTGNYLITHPSRNTDFHCKLSGIVFVDTDSDITVPRIMSGLLQRNSLTLYLQVRSIGHKQIHIHVLVLHRINISRQRGDKTTDIGRAAGTTEPRLALMLADTFQRIGIEKAASVQ